MDAIADQLRELGRVLFQRSKGVVLVAVDGRWRYERRIEILQPLNA